MYLPRPISFHAALIVTALGGSLPAGAASSATPQITLTDATPSIDLFATGPATSGNGASGFGGVVGDATMHMDTNRAGDMEIGVVRGSAPLNDHMVIYIDSKADGFADTLSFHDSEDRGRRAISGDSGTVSNDLVFAPGFLADFAIVLDAGVGSLFELAAGGAGSQIYVASVNAGDGSTAVTYTLTLAMEDVGLVAGDSFDFLVTYLNANTQYRSDEYIAAVGPDGSSAPGGETVLLDTDFGRFQSICAAGYERDGTTCTLVCVAADCDDGNACTDDACDSANGCSSAHNTASCDDADSCTENDVCGGGTCSGIPLRCDDDNPCTDEACSMGACVYTNNVASCDDMDVCTFGDVCAVGVCRGERNSCDDGDVCTDDACDPGTGSCVSAAVAGCCVKDTDCDDGDECTTDSCMRATGACESLPIAGCGVIDKTSDVPNRKTPTETSSGCGSLPRLPAIDAIWAFGVLVLLARRRRSN